MWQLSPTPEPVRVIPVSGPAKTWGLRGSATGTGIAAVAAGTVLLWDWRDLGVVEELPAELLPDRVQGHPAWSSDGRLLALTGGEELVIVDVARGLRYDADVDGDEDGIMFGDWSITPRFSPDGRRLAVGNSMQGTVWLSMIDVSADVVLTERYARGDVPQRDLSELVVSVVFSPDGSRFAAWVRPDVGRTRADGYRGGLVVRESATGDPVWDLRVDNEVTGVPGVARSAPLCFTACGTWIAVGLDTGVLWVDAGTGVPAVELTPIGEVHALAGAAHVGVVAATDHGVHLLSPPAR
ncbi:WD40 repeat domain-containing protein [Nocardia sp. AG03]|uniref:WD40 repeat domain-containing protein n=1 Tax=Nocardia sp. AG03 TaxID=3025312 RepID=UPI00241867C0|nr:WD40 repeat domain-containing protein [Nocardia sp. AG03]